MVKVSELLSKKLIALSKAQVIGTVSNIIFNSKLSQGKALKIYNDDGNGVETCFVELKKVKNFKNDAVVMADDSAIVNEWNMAFDGVVNPMNCECFNQDGKSLGVVRDILLDNLTVKSIIIDKKEFSPEQVLSYSDKLLILNDTGKPIKLAKPRQMQVPKAAKADTIVTVHAPAPSTKTPPLAAVKPTPPATEPSTSPQVKINISPQDVHLPHKVPPSGTVISTPSATDTSQTPYKFLVGKTLLRALYDDEGVLIAQENSTISPETINCARNKGKLVQLALYAE